MSGAYEGRQIVGMDLHRRRSVLVRMTETGERLETVRISNDPEYLRQVMARAGEAPEVVLEAAYGWYWAADALAELGATRASGAPVGGEDVRLRRVKNDERDAADLADLLRMGRLPEAWIAPPATRELRGWVRHRAKLVGLRSSLQLPDPRRAGRRGRAGADERPVRRVRTRTARDRGVDGRSPARGWSRCCGSSARWISRSTSTRSWSPAGCAPTPATTPSRPSPGSGRSWPRCSSPRSATSPASTAPPQLASWAGLTPKHHESDTTVHRGRITKQGSRLVRWAAVEAVQRVPAHTRLGQRRDRVAERRGRNIGVVAAARDLITLVFYGLRDHHLRCLPTQGGAVSPCWTSWWTRIVVVMIPEPARRDRPI